MTTHIGSTVLVPLDGSRDVRSALGPAAEVAASGDGELVLVLVVTSGFERMIGEWDVVEHMTSEQSAAQYLKQVETGVVGELDDVRVRTVVRTSEDPAEEILEVAREVGASLIAMTSHGYTGFKKLMIGSVADAVLRRSEFPVLIVPIGDRTAST